MKGTIATVLGGAALAALAQGCALKADDAERFREPIPQASDAALAVPGSQASGGATGQSASAVTLRVQGAGAGGAAAAGTYATFYDFTRGVADGVDFATLAILGAVEIVVSLPPTTIDATHAVWGPGGSALDPIAWKLTVTEASAGGYDYEVDGRPHLSTSDADWKAVLTGFGYDKASANHRSGHFHVDRDALHTLDPQDHPETGAVDVTYDARTYPVNVEAKATTDDGTGAWFDATVTHDAGGAGQVALTALADISTPADGTNESVVEESQWNATGAGRADVKMSGGDFGSTTVLASQCWSDAFTQTYSTDNVDYQPTAGVASACVFPAATLGP
jgi:hypothetical protein